MEIGPQLRQLHFSHEASHVMGVNTDVGRRERGTGKLRIDAPSASLVIGRNGRDRPILTELDMHLADAAQFAGPHHLARLANHGEGGEAVSHAKNYARSALPLNEIKCISQIGGQRLFAYDIDALIKKGDADRVMGRVGRVDCDRVDAVRSSSFARSHFAVARIASLWRQIPVCAGGACRVWIRRQSACDHIPTAGQSGALGMKRPDEPASASHHAQP